MRPTASSLTLLVILASLVTALSPAEEILTASFTGASPGANTPWTPTTALRPELTYSGWVRGAGTQARPTNDRFGFNVVGPAEPVQSTLAEAIAENEYIGFTLTPGATPLDLGGTQVTFTVQRESFHAPRRYAVLTSVSGFSDDAALYASPFYYSELTTPQTNSFFLPLTGYDDLTAPVEFRLYAFNANYNHATSLSAWSIATYDGNLYNVTVAAGAGGTSSISPEKSLFAEGETVQFSAVPGDGQRFAGWSGTVTGFGNPLTLTVAGETAVTANFEPLVNGTMQLGMNLGEVNDYTSDWPFVDSVKRIRYWLTRSVGGVEYSSGFSAEIPLDSRGWPLQVPFNVTSSAQQQIAHTILVEPGPPGDRLLIFEGTGTLRFRPGGPSLNPVGTGPQQSIPFTTDGVASMLLDILTSSAADPIRNIRIVEPQHAATSKTEPFHPVYLDRVRPFSCLRFMDWGRTNASPLTTWEGRSQPGFYTQSQGGGVSLEYVADITNLLDQDAWVCIPHAADDNYVREAARLLRDRVEPGRRIYVEYSNETWNTAGPFTQTTYVQDQGEALNLFPGNRWQSGQYFCALRSVQIWRIFREEFGAAADERLIEVLGTQSNGFSVTQMRTAALNNPAINPDRVMPRALAIAPYFGIVYRPEFVVGGYPTVDDLVTTVSQTEIENNRAIVRTQLDFARTQGWDLICYEGGQHFVGAAGAENDQTLTDILIATNRDPRMYDRYTEYLNMLDEEGITMFANFTYVGAPGRYGSWGALETQEQDLADAHKYRALIDWRNAHAPQADEWAVR